MKFNVKALLFSVIFMSVFLVACNSTEETKENVSAETLANVQVTIYPSMELNYHEKSKILLNDDISFVGFEDENTAVFSRLNYNSSTVDYFKYNVEKGTKLTFVQPAKDVSFEAVVDAVNYEENSLTITFK